MKKKSKKKTKRNTLKIDYRKLADISTDSNADLETSNYSTTNNVQNNIEVYCKKYFLFRKINFYFRKTIMNYLIFQILIK
jgi:hypothetical protein